MRKRTWLVVFVLAVVVMGSVLGATSAFAGEPAADEPAVPGGDWEWDMAAHCPGMSDGSHMGEGSHMNGGSYMGGGMMGRGMMGGW